MKSTITFLFLLSLSLSFSSNSLLANPTLKQDAYFKAGGPICFGPKGLLFASDPQSAAVLAIKTGDTKKAKGTFKVDGLQKKLVGLLGTKSDSIRIVDLAVNPSSGNAYLSVTRGSGKNSHGALVKVSTDGKLSLVNLSKLKQTRATLNFAPVDKEIRIGRRKKNPRKESITDLAFVNGRLFVAGLSNEEFSSTLRSLPYPFDKQSKPSTIQIYHGAHGKFETHSPVRTFLPYEIDGKMNILAAYTCTPLVKIPISDLKPGSKVTGTTIAELGNWNHPLDMIAYKKNGESYLLMANTNRGIMKFKAADITEAKSIPEERVKRGEKAGVKYETIKKWTGVEQLDLLDNKNALVVRKLEEGGIRLESLPLP